MYKKVWSKNVSLCISLFCLIKLNTILRPRINKSADIESPWGMLLSNLKCFVVIPAFTMHDSWLFNRAFIYLMNVLPNPYLFQTKLKNWWLTESKAFWMSTVTNIPFNIRTSVLCKTSAIKRSPSLMNLPST